MKQGLLILCAAGSILLSPFLVSAAVQPTWGINGLTVNNTPGNTTQQNLRSVSLGDGTDVIVWEDGRLGFLNLYAQRLDAGGNRLWDKDGVPVSSGGNQTSAQIIADGAGGVIIAWQDYRNDNADIYAQKLNRQGQPLWGTDGIAVCRAPAGQFSPQLVGNGAGGAIIVWHDYRSGGGEDIFAQHLASEGQPLWAQDGQVICEAKGTQWFPKIVSDGQGGAVMVWTDGREGSSDNNIYAQRVDPAGKTLWQKDGIVVCTCPQNQEHPAVIAVDDGFIIAWDDSRPGNIDIYAQKIDLDGKIRWDKDGVAATTAYFSQEQPRLTADGEGGAVLTWNDSRGDESVIFAQRITRSGRIDWGENGRPLARTSAKQENPEIVKSGSGFAVVWQDYRKGLPLLFGQKLNLAGNPLWPEGGVMLAAGLKLQEKHSLTVSAGGDILAAWQDLRNGSYDLYAQKISTAGEILWDEFGLVVCSANGSVSHQNAALIDGGGGKTIAVFEDARFGFINIYAQCLARDGTLLWGKDGIPVAKVRANQADPQVISDGAGGVLVAWVDGRNNNYQKIYAQRIFSNGQKAWQKGSQPLTKIDSRQARPRLIADGAGGALVLWEDERNPLSLKDLYAQRVSAMGDLLWGKNGQVICSENGEQGEAALIPDGSAGAFLAWADYRHGDRNPDIYAQRLTGSGKLLWDKEGILICGAPDVQRTPQLAKDGEGGAVIVWTDKGGGSYDIYSQRVDGKGQTMWLTDGIPICQLGRTQQNPKIGGKRIVVWEDYRYGNWDISAGSVSNQGKLLWGEEGVKLSSLAQTQYAPQIADWKNGGLLVTWEDYRSNKQYEIYFQQIAEDGSLGLTVNGAPVKSADGARSPKIVGFPKENSTVIVWEDYSGGGKSLYGQRFTLD